MRRNIVPIAAPTRSMASAWGARIGGRCALVLAFLALGCEGVLGTPAGSSDFANHADGANGSAGGNGSGGSGGGGGIAIPDPDAPGDIDRMNDNPELFDIAKQYFPSDDARPGAKRLFRLTRRQLDLTTQTLLPAYVTTAALDALPRDPLETNYEYANNLSMNSANFTPYMTWVKDIAARVGAAPEGVIGCASDMSDTCLAREAKRFVQRAFRGAASEAQLARYADFYTDSVRDVGFAEATRDLVELTLAAPSYLYRDETRTDDNHQLLPAQLLQHLTYTLADAPPEALGLSSLDAAQYLASQEELSRTIDRVLAHELAREKLQRFFKAWLEVKEPEDFDISRTVFPEFTPEVAEAVAAETEEFLRRQLSTAVPRLKDLTEATEAIVSEETAFLYGLRGPSAGLVELDPNQRIGIFTQPAVIASHSGPTTTRLVKRGVFFVRKVMCMELGSPPPALDTSIPDSLMGTERQKVESVTANAPCTGCHAFINPFGFMQENYDAIGRFRTEDENGEPIDARISINFLDEGEFETGSPVDALRRFTRSYRFQQCFARQLFRFYTGREETKGDHPTLRRMFFDFADDEKQDIVGMLHSLASSGNFSRRTEAP